MYYLDQTVQLQITWPPYGDTIQTNTYDIRQSTISLPFAHVHHVSHRSVVVFQCRTCTGVNLHTQLLYSRTKHFNLWKWREWLQWSAVVVIIVYNSMFISAGTNIIKNEGKYGKCCKLTFLISHFSKNTTCTNCGTTPEQIHPFTAALSL